MDLKLTVRASVEPSEMIELFIKDIEKYKPLTKNEELKMFEAMELGKMAEAELLAVNQKDPIYAEYKKLVAEASAAREAVINSNQKFIYAMAKRFRQDDMVMDLISEGNIGMIEAMGSYDMSKGVRFTTYASWYINRNMQNFVNNHSLLIQRPNNIISNIKVSQFENKFFAENGRIPEQEETYEALTEMGEYFPKKEDMYGIGFYSIDYNNQDDDEDDCDMQSQPIGYINAASVNNEYEEKSVIDDANVVIDGLMSCLTDRERKVLRLAYGFETGGEELTNKEIGEIIGISSERARQIRNTAFEKVRSSAESAVVK